MILFVAMISLAAGELCYTTKFYSAQYEKLSYLAQCFDEDPKNLYNEKSVTAYKAAYEHWEKNKEKVMAVSNHNTVRYVDEKYVALNELIRLNQESDAYVALKSVMNYIEDLKKDNYPIFSNLL